MKDDGGKRIGFDRILLQNLSVSRIRKLAHFIDLEKTAYWHARLALALREANHLEAAIREYYISLRIDEQSWSAKFGLAACYEARRDYTLAIEWELNALASVPDDQKDWKRDFWQNISIWKQEIGDVEGAIQASKEACNLHPENMFAASRHLNALNAGGRHQEILQFTEALEKTRSATTNEANEPIQFEILMHLGGEALENAAKALGRLEFFSNAIETSIAAAERRKSEYYVAELQYRFGCFKFRHFENTDEAMELWELVLESHLRSSSMNQLSQLYFDRAVNLEKQGLSPDPWISKLESLCRQADSSEGDDDVFSKEDASKVLGLWYRLHDKHDKAKACFKATVLEAIDILTDDDPENDWFGYTGLAEALLMAGDKVNASAAFAFTTARLDKLKDVREAMQKEQAMTSVKESRIEDEESTGETLGVEMNSLVIRAGRDDTVTTSENIAEPVLMVETTHRKLDEISNKADDDSVVSSDDAEVEQRNPYDPTKVFWWTCDGECKSKYEAWTAFYFCELCLDTAFCDQCIELVRTDRLTFRKCSSTHPFYQVYPTAHKMEDTNTVIVDGKTLPRTEWLANLRKQWEG